MEEREFRDRNWCPQNCGFADHGFEGSSAPLLDGCNRARPHRDLCLKESHRSIWQMIGQRWHTLDTSWGAEGDGVGKLRRGETCHNPNNDSGQPPPLVHALAILRSEASRSGFGGRTIVLPPPPPPQRHDMFPPPPICPYPWSPDGGDTVPWAGRRIGRPIGRFFFVKVSCRFVLGL